MSSHTCPRCGVELSGPVLPHDANACANILEARVAALESQLAAARVALRLAREVRMYALGSDVSTRNLIERFDAALAALGDGTTGGGTHG